MKGVVFTGSRQLELMDFPDPEPGPDDVVLEIRASGMCGSDLKWYRAPDLAAEKASLGFGGAGSIIGGHEPSGVVVAVGSQVQSNLAWIGMRAMQHHYMGCGVCGECKTGWPQVCHDGVSHVWGTTHHGSHARYMKVPAVTLVRMPDELSFDAGAAISCGTGTAWGILKRLGITGDQTIAVFGQGPVGLSVTLLAKAMGAQVIALDISDERLTKALQLGADHAINPGACDDVEGAIRELTHGRGAHASVDATSSPLARRQAVRCLRSWGKCVYVGEGGEVTFDVSNDIIRRQATIMGSWVFSTIQQEECAQFVAARGLDLGRLFTERWRLEEAVQAYELFDRQTTGKGVITPT
jgi:threonine dehydrogenase-like Zn-dependent dehydrogenase